MTVRRTILTLEELGQRILPSASPVYPGIFGEMSQLAAPHSAAEQSHHALSGAGSGTYTVSTLLADVTHPNFLGAPASATPPLHIIVGDLGKDYIFDGTAHLARLGNVTVQGSVLGLGNVATGHANGMLTFSNAHGSVTISLEGPSQPGFSPLPTHFKYTVVDGTGAYAHVHDQGTLSLVLHPDTGTGTSPGVQASQGTFTLLIP